MRHRQEFPFMKGDLKSKASYIADMAAIQRQKALAAAEEIAWNMHVERMCEEYDREELDRFALGFDAAILREERGRYNVTLWKVHIQWLQEYIQHPDPISRSSAQWRLECIESELEELDRRREQEAKDQEERDAWMDAKAALLSPTP